jgi:hypothetical protein
MKGKKGKDRMKLSLTPKLIDGFLRLKIPWVKDPSSHLLIYVCSGSG